MASLYELLAGGLGNEEDYLAKDPWFMGGAQWAKTPITPKTSKEAVWAPFVQGLTSGAMMGYGKKSANKEAYGDYSQLLKGTPGYESEEMPEGWSIKQGKSNLVGRLLAAQQQDQLQREKVNAYGSLQRILIGKGFIPTPEGTLQEIPEITGLKTREFEERTRQGIIRDLTKTATSSPRVADRRAAAAQLESMLRGDETSPISAPQLEDLPPENARLEELAQKYGDYGVAANILQTEGIEAAKKERLDAEAERTGIPRTMPQSARDEITGTLGALKQLEATEGELLEKFGNTSRAEWAIKSRFAAFDEGKMSLQLDLLAKVLTRAIEGARPSDYDAKTYQRILKGDGTVHPKDIINLIQQVRGVQATRLAGIVDGYRAMEEGRLGDTIDRHTKVPAGMKLQRNKVTGETRLVPQ